MLSFINRLRKSSELLALSLIVLAVVSRWLPHPPNVAPVAAIAIFSGLVIKQRWAIIVPLMTLLLSDLVLGFYGPVMLAVYFSFGLSFLFGRWMNQKIGIFRIIIGTLCAAGVFFLITNAAVWMFGNMYQHNIYGLGQSYLAGLPFFKNSLFGDFMYLGIFMSLWRLAGQSITVVDQKKLLIPNLNSSLN